MGSFSDVAPELEEITSARREILSALKGLISLYELTRDQIPEEEIELTEPLNAVGRALDELRELSNKKLPENEAAASSLLAKIPSWQTYQRKLIHDLRNPLGVALGYNELLEETLEDFIAGRRHPWAEEAQHQLSHFQEQLQHFLEFINRLFLTRPVTGNHTPLNEIRVTQRKTPVTPAIPKSNTQAQLPRELTAPEKSSGHQTGQILVVDDSASNRELLGSMLKREGHQTLSASSALEALAILEREQVDICLLDLFMPQLNGDVFLQQLRATPRFRQLPVIMISGDAELASVIRCIELGAEDYLQKPFNRVLSVRGSRRA